MDDNTYFELTQAIGRAFSPAAPITDRDMFKGRGPQLNKLVRVVSQRSQHALVYGERGVGKTSLARVTQALIDASPSLTSYYTCHTDDGFDTIWRGLLENISVVKRVPSLGFKEEVRSLVSTAAEMLADDDVGPRAVVHVAKALTAQQPFVVVIDEFDRPTDPKVRTLMADTIKIFADQVIPVSVILVGVADTVEELIAEHESIQRPLVQVQMPRMTEEEIRDIVRNGMDSAGMKVETAFVDEVSALSQGFPHFAHLLGQHGALRAIENGRTTVRHADFDDALAEALDGASQSVRERYHNATFSNRKTLYKEVLLACALTEKDDMGSFGAPDVRDRLREITSTDYDIPAFAAHLKDFSSTDTRGGILQRIGTTRRFRYRFRDPLMPPYVVMKGRHEGLI